MEPNNRSLNLHVDDLLNRFVDGLHPLDNLAIDQPEPELPPVAPAEVHLLVAGEGPHKLKGVTGHVFENGVELGRRLSADGTAAGGGDLRLGREVLLKLYDKRTHVGVDQAHQNGLCLAIFAGQNVGCDDALLSCGEITQFLHVDCTLQDRGEDFMIHLLGHLDRIFLVTVNLQLEDADTAGAAVLLHRVDS